MGSNLTVSLTESQRKHLIEVYTRKVQLQESQLNEDKAFLLQLLDSPSVGKNQLPLSNNGVSITGYVESWGWAKKIGFTLRRRGRLLTARQILDDIKTNEPMSKDPITSISATLSSNISNNKLFNKFKPEGSVDFLYGLKEWFDESGRPSDLYHPDKLTMSEKTFDAVI